MREYPEIHQQGVISIENMPDELDDVPSMMKGDFGIQIAKDGRIWICINGLAFLRFSPHPNEKMERKPGILEDLALRDINYPPLVP